MCRNCDDPGSRDCPSLCAKTVTKHPQANPYDSISELYDPWSVSVTEDVGFYLDEARRSGGSVVELGIGTGRIAVPIAADGIRVIGVDSSRGMLDVCARHRRLALSAARRLLVPGGRLVFDVFTPGPDDIEQTHDRWVEREPGIWERAVWNMDARTLTLSVRGEETAATTMALAWIEPAEWRVLLEETGFEVEACYGWFDRSPFTGGEDTIWVAGRSS